MMKKMALAGIVICMLLSVCACSSKNDNGKKETGAKNNVQMDEIRQLTLEEVFQKIDDKERFVFMVTQSTCSYCNAFKRTLIPFLREHPALPFYEIEVDMLGTMKADIDTNFRKLKKKVEAFSGGTPELFYYENGVMKKHTSGDMSEAALWNFMIDCALIKGDKKEEKTMGDTTLHPGDRIRYETLKTIERKISNKERFYLMINETDRYNQDFVEKLNKVLKEEEADVVGLKFPIQDQGDQEELNEAYTAIMECTNDIKMTPVLYLIKDGKAEKLVEDNVSIEMIRKALSKE